MVTSREIFPNACDVREEYEGACLFGQPLDELTQDQKLQNLLLQRQLVDEEGEPLPEARRASKQTISEPVVHGQDNVALLYALSELLTSEENPADFVENNSLVWEAYEQLLIANGAPTIIVNGQEVVDWNADDEAWANVPPEIMQVADFVGGRGSLRNYDFGASNFHGDAFNHAVDIVLVAEGGFNPGNFDAGGATYMGIASRYHPEAYREIMSLRGNPEAATAYAKDFYQREFWDRAGIDNITDPRAQLIAFDTAVNAGVGTARRHLAIAGQDGVITAEELLDLKRSHYESLNATGNPNYTRNFRGWMNRIDHLESEVAQMSAPAPVLA